jgi:hypothetical protein
LIVWSSTCRAGCQSRKSQTAHAINKAAGPRLSQTTGTLMPGKGGTECPHGDYGPRRIAPSRRDSLRGTL